MGKKDVEDLKNNINETVLIYKDRKLHLILQNMQFFLSAKELTHRTYSGLKASLNTLQRLKLQTLL